jgi:hypothetical protein
MKFLTTTLLIIAFGLSASALDWTGRLEARDSMTSSSVCSGVSGCSTNTNVGFGAGVTVPVWNFAADWSLVTGALLRQEIVSGSYSVIGTATATYLYLDIPVGVQWNWSPIAVRLAADLGVKLSSTYSTYTSNTFTDNSIVVPVELAFDWTFLPNQLINVTYETGVTTANLASGYTGNALATANTIVLGYGYTF